MISHAQAVATRDARPLQTPVEGLNLPLGASLGLAEALAQALDARDRYTAGHSLRVAEYAHAIARELQLVERDVEIIRLAAWLHDVGKIGIPDAVLLKPGPLTAEEFGLVKLHPQIERRILERAPGFERCWTQSSCTTKISTAPGIPTHSQAKRFLWMHASSGWPTPSTP